MDFSPLEHLLKAPSKEFIVKLLNDVFLYRDSNVPETILRAASEAVEVETSIGQELLKLLKNIIKMVLFDGLADQTSILSIFPDSFTQANLKNLLAKLLAEQVPRFKKFIVDNQNMIPKLLEFDWRVDIKVSQNLSTNEADTSKQAVGQQACILQLKELGIQTFFARLHPNDKCGSNGLPLTPNSIRVYGRFQKLIELHHKNLCRYVDIQRGSQERLFVIVENYTLKITDLLDNSHLYNLILNDFTDDNLLFRWFYQILDAHKTLHDQDIINKCICLNNLFLDEDFNLKLSNYGLHHMTEYGLCVSFQLGDRHYLPPECYLIDYLANKNEIHQYKSLLNNPKIDVWSIGVCFFILIYYQKMNHLKIVENDSLAKFMLEALRSLHTDDSAYNFFIDSYSIDTLYQQKIENRWRFLIPITKKCLIINVAQRPTIHEIFQMFSNELQKKINASGRKFEFISNENNAQHRNFFNSKSGSRVNTIKTNFLPKIKDMKNDFLTDNIDQIYYLWRLTGGDCMQTLKAFNALSQVSSIHKTSKLITLDDGCEHGKPEDNEQAFNDCIIPISLKQLKNRLQQIKMEIFYPLIEICNESKSSKYNDNDFDLDSLQKQPLNIRESDIEYQLSRILLFSRLLSAYPYKKADLYKECRVDIPPLYRAHAWASLLGITHDFNDIYDKIDKEQITSTDRQIDVDVPRCHQYDTLMASPEAHFKLKRILKAWVITNKNQLVYWQGLDSLCAPFLYLNFNYEALAFACMNEFIKKYAAKFFLQDNSEVIHEYLQVFSHLIAFHDPQLANHFEEIDFRPDLYAIPWFLTMFAHIFPLYKIFHLWDTLLLGSQSFPLFIGVSILMQLRGLLLNSDFNECILLFSELPEINISKCVDDSIKICCATPASCLYRKHSNYQEVPSEISDFNMSALTLDEMKAKLCPDISPGDIDEFNKTPNPAKLIIIDIRNALEYASQDLNQLKNSKNFPFDLLKFDKLKQLAAASNKLQSDDANAQLIAYLNQNKYLVKIIASSRARLNEATELANLLVKLNFSKICILHKGLESFLTN